MSRSMVSDRQMSFVGPLETSDRGIEDFRQRC